MGDMDGCKSLGDIYENGRGGQEIDDKKSMQLYQKACSGGVGAACWKLAGYYDEGRGVERNLAEAFKFYQTALRMPTASSRKHFCTIKATA